MEFISNKKDFSLEEIEGGYFWRYLDIFQLISLLESKTIYFSRADKFEDITECLSDKGFSKISLGEGYKHITNPKIFEKTRKSKAQYLDDGEDIISQEISKAKNAQQFHFISCWHFGNRESIAMWNQYSDKKGFAIKINARKLFEQIKKEALNIKNDYWERMSYGFLNYRELTPFDHFSEKNKENLEKPNLFLGFNKDSSYEHEKEFRFIAASSEAKKESLQLRVEAVIDDFELICSPYFSKWEEEVASQIIFDTFKKEIKKSNIYLRLFKS